MDDGSGAVPARIATQVDNHKKTIAAALGGALFPLRPGTAPDLHRRRDLSSASRGQVLQSPVSASDTKGHWAMIGLARQDVLLLYAHSAAGHS